MDFLTHILEAANAIIWHDWVLYAVLGVGVLFTLWSGFCQYRALTHGSAVTLGAYDEKSDPGAINHFQALSAALSATVGLGNIGGVALAIGLGGPGAVFWMWMIGLAGMALKTTEVTLSMLYRSTENPDEPHGGPMWVAKKAFAERGLAPLGTVIGGIFCVTLLISTVTGGNMFQAWNVAVVTERSFDVPQIATGIILAVLVALVIIGGIKRIGAVAGKLVPLMCAIYLLASIWVLISNAGEIPEVLGLIFTSAFSPAEAKGAFVGGTASYAFFWGMKRALFSSEAGQGSSPIAHCAAKTGEPVREAIVAGLEPFIDTIVVCTLTAMVILSTGAWSRKAEGTLDAALAFVPATTEVGWVLGTPVQEDDKIWGTTALPPRSERAKEINGSDWVGNEQVFVVARWGIDNPDTGSDLHKITGTVALDTETGRREIRWAPIAKEAGITKPPTLLAVDDKIELHVEYPGAALTAYAFNRSTRNLGKYLVVIASWLFALSTMISWSYYGEQGVIYLFGARAVFLYKLVYCALIVVATAGLITTDAELDALTGLGTGVMLWANIPLMLVFGPMAMKAYHAYGRKLKAGEFHAHARPRLRDVVEGRDVE